MMTRLAKLLSLCAATWLVLSPLVLPLADELPDAHAIQASARSAPPPELTAGLGDGTHLATSRDAERSLAPGATSLAVRLVAVAVPALAVANVAVLGEAGSTVWRPHVIHCVWRC